MNMCNFGAQGLHNLILLPSVHVSLSCEVELRTKRAITIVIPVGHVSMHLQHRSSLFGSEHACVFTQTAFASRSDVHRSRLQVSGRRGAQRVGAPKEWVANAENVGARRVGCSKCRSLFPSPFAMFILFFSLEVFSWNCGRDSRPQGAQTRTSAGPRP